MKTVRRFFGTAAALGGLALPGAFAQDTTRPNPNPPVNDIGEPKARTGVVSPERSGERAERKASEGRLYDVDRLVGAKIRNPQGEDLGKVEELVVDTNTGDIRYAVVSYGGFLSLGDKLFAVPLQAMKLNRDADDSAFYVVDIDQSRLENSEGFDKDKWPNFADASFTSGVDRVYGVPARQASGAVSLYKLSTFDGVNVRSREGKELAEVETILVDPAAAKVLYLGLELEDEAEDDADDRDDAEDGDDVLVLVPMEQVSLETKNDDTFLQVSGTTEEIQTAPKVTEEELKNAASHRELRHKVDEHFGGIDKTNDAVKSPGRSE